MDDDSNRTERAPSSRLKIGCPFCQERVEVDSESSLSAIECKACGNEINLIGDETVTEGHAPQKKRIAHFELIETLGSGAFGTVWKARDTKLDRLVAIKVPRKGELNPQESEKFLREARAAAQLQHPNIVSVHEVGREEDTVYIVSDFVQGLSLADWLTAKKPSARDAAQWCLKIATALHHAHEAGVIHRDLKPHNIMLDSQNEPFLMDFGLARREAGEVTMTMEGKVLGTPAYMSPEQARGEGHVADRRTDVYSLGVILYQLLCGSVPFRGNLRMILHQVMNEEVSSPRRRNRDVPRDLETICMKCLEKDPDARYPTVEKVAEELSRFLDGEPIQARPISTFEWGWRWSRRKPVEASLSFLVVVLVFGLVAIGLLKETSGSDTYDSLAIIIKAENPESKALSGELARGLIDRFSMLSEATISVLHRSQVLKYEEAIIDDKWVRTALDVKALLYGTVDDKGDEVVLQLKLAATQNSEPIWDKKFTGPEGALPGVEGGVIREVIEALGLRLESADARIVSESNLENRKAFEHYITGRRLASAIDPQRSIGFRSGA